MTPKKQSSKKLNNRTQKNKELASVVVNRQVTVKYCYKGSLDRKLEKQGFYMLFKDALESEKQPGSLPLLFFLILLASLIVSYFSLHNLTAQKANNGRTWGLAAYQLRRFAKCVQ